MTNKMIIALIAVVISSLALAAGNTDNATSEEVNDPLKFRALGERWDEFDLNRDNRIDQIEMARFDREWNYRKLDQDADNYISRIEAEPVRNLSTQWNNADVNSDDRLEFEEFARFEVMNDFQNIDTDQDGSISKREAINIPSLIDHWADIDKDNNELISQAEYEQL